MSEDERVDEVFSMVDNEQDDLVEISQIKNYRSAVSSGASSLDEGLADDDRALSDSDVTRAARTQTIATQVKGPSSDALETSCKLEHEARQRGEDWEDIFGSGQLLKKTLRKGHGEVKSRDGQWVTVKIVDTLRDLDSHECLRFVTGFGMVIDAWEIVVKLMVEGELCAIRTDARFAYGDLGLDEPEIGPNLQMEYTLELVEIGESPKYLTMPNEELSDFVIMIKERGNFFFSRKDYEKAIFVYRRAVNIIDPSNIPEEEDGLRKLFSALHSNIAVCYSKLEDWPAVLDSASQSLTLHPLNTKALFRRASAYLATKDVEKALEDLKRAQEIDPNDKAVRLEIERVLGLKKERREKEKQIYRRMVSGLSSEDYPTPGERPWAIVEFLKSPRNVAVTSFFILMLALFIHFLMALNV